MNFRHIWHVVRLWCALAAILFIATSGVSRAATDAALADRLHRFTQDLRCLVCQNESLADSRAPLALDLKREIRQKMEQGDSDAQIRDFLRQRYGDFVNYNPPVSARTLLLWVGPLLLLVAGAVVVWQAVRPRQAQDGADDSPDPGGDARTPGRWSAPPTGSGPSCWSRWPWWRCSPRRWPGRLPTRPPGAKARARRRAAPCARGGSSPWPCR